MLKKRLIGVITVKNGWAVQSQGYRRHLPLGRPEFLAENLDRWGADEILVVSIDRTPACLGPDFALLRRLSAMGLSTPLAFGGGIRRVADAGTIIQLGAERVCVDTLLHEAPDVVREISLLIGAQALIGVLPLSLEDGTLSRLDYGSRNSAPLSPAELSLFETKVVSEALIVDWRNEGCAGSFTSQLIDSFPVDGVPLIAFGGISEAKQMRALLQHKRVAAVGVGNFLSYREHAVQDLKSRAAADSLRPALSGTGSR